MISVLTVNYRSAADVARLAASLVEHRGNEQIELIIANNSPAEAIERPSELANTVIDLPNPGYARGVNAAAARARGDVLFVANPDVRLTPGVLPAASAWLRDHPEVGILLPRLRSPDGAIQSSVRRFYTWPVALYARLPLRDRIRHPRFFRRYLMLDDDISSPAAVDWGLGAAMFLRRADFADGRIFDERFFLYFEDVDLCLRAWQRGRPVIYHPGLVCEHDHHRTSKRVLSKHALHHLTSLVRFVVRHHGLPQRPVPPT